MHFFDTTKVAPIASALFLSLTPTLASNLTNNALLSSGNVILNDRWSLAYEKAKTLASQMTNEEKINVTTSLDIASFSEIQSKDGSQGLIGYYASGFSQTSALAATWDRNLIYEQMRAVGTEFYNKGYQMINGPTCGPLGGVAASRRLNEGLGQDSYLNGIATGLAVLDLSDAGVIPQEKHFLLSEQETNRTAGAGSWIPGVIQSYSSDADKVIHETYLWPFYDAVKAGIGAVMCAMNAVNGTQSCENSGLLNGILKIELGFPGMVLPDVWSQFTSYGSLNSGDDDGSSSLWSEEIIMAGLKNGSVTQDRLDDMAIRNVIGYFYVGLDQGDQPTLATHTLHRDVRTNNSNMIRAHGSAAMTLLKNVDNALPLKVPLSVAIFGAHAGPVIGGPNVGFSINGTVKPIYLGHLAGSTGSGAATFPYLMTPYDALNQRAMTDGTMLSWIMSDDFTPPTGRLYFLGSNPGDYSFGTGTNQNVSIPDYASNTEVCIVFLNAWFGEGSDRTELRNVQQDNLVLEVASHCNNTMVVVNSGGPRILSSWNEHENVTAILYNGLLGQDSGLSFADVLHGDVNLSARLIHTIAKDESDYPTSICYTAQCNFTEGNYIDYKHFDRYDITPSNEFGYGLSYTSFNYSRISVEQLTPINETYACGVITQGGRADLWNDIFTVRATIQNMGKVVGHEVAQQLRGFDRIFLGVDATATVEFPLRRRELSYWDVVAQEWAVAEGVYTFSVGASSRGLKLMATYEVKVVE